MMPQQAPMQVLHIQLDSEIPGKLSETNIRRFQDRLKTAEADPRLVAVVISGLAKVFTSDHDFFGAEDDIRIDDVLRETLSQIEAFGKPVVAAIQDQVLDRGLELALACHARVADAAAMVGFEGIKFGLVPGNGGTQRLPRLIGIELAYDLIQEGRPSTAHRLRESGLFDLVVTAHVQEAAQGLAYDMAGRLAAGEKLRRTGDLMIDPDMAVAVLEAKKGKLNSRQRQQAALMALPELMLYAAQPFEKGCRQERALYQALASGTQARALRHQFKAERAAVEMPEELRVAPRKIDTVAVIGAGTMGAGIAIAALDGGVEVILVEQTEEALARGVERISTHYEARTSAGKMSPAAAKAMQSRLLPTTEWHLIARADLVVEAVFEDIEVKRQVFARLDSVARPGAVLATNTSYLDIDQIARATSRPEDVVGLHFFSPANVMKLLEVVRTESATADVLATAMAFGRTLKKVPVLCGNAFGFIGNRIYNAYRKQCEFMLEDGAWPEQIDQALTEMGFAMGPFAVADMSGLDIAWRMRQAQAATRDPRERYVDILDKLCEQGRLGRKTGAGYYTYVDGNRGRESDEVVRAVIAAARARHGQVTMPLDANAIQRRALLAMLNEAALLLAEGVAARPSDIDVVLVQGYGFPRWLGGPVFWARQQARKSLDEELDKLIEQSGYGAVRASREMLDALLLA
jgi:3-hydroxyacyl-CoA dehydrogenase